MSKLLPGIVGAITLAIVSVAVYIEKQRAKKQLKYQRSSKPFVRIPLNRLPALKNDLVLRAAMNLSTPRVPVWCMRQAGRHLPEFRALREEGYDFFTMCQVPELAVEVSLQPLRRYGVDAVIIFCDILVVPQAMGMEVNMVAGVGPVFAKPLRDPKDIKLLRMNPDVQVELGYVMDALNLARQTINGQVPLIGFCGGPFTLLTYMVEGQGSKTKSKIKTWLYKYPQESHNVLQAITDVCVEFLIAQQQAGAQALQVFETVGAEVLTRDHFYEFAFTYLAQIAARVKDVCPETPLIAFSKGTDYAFERLAETKYDCLGLDWSSDPANVRMRIKNKKALQGNMDPACMYAELPTIQTEVVKMLHNFGTKGYVANFGHGCFPDMDPSHVDTFIKTVQSKSIEMNNQ